jgi:serine/threonine-protein kinase
VAENHVDQVIAEFLEGAAAGKEPDREELLARHPDLADELRSFLAEHDRMRAIAERIQSPSPSPASALNAVVAQGTAVRYFGDYEILGEVARGGMGVVFRARQISLNRTVALKMILAGQLASPVDIQRFHLEAEAAANLDHPNIVPIYEVGEHQGQHYFSMKLIDGGILVQQIPELLRDPKTVARLVATVARGVHNAHQRGVLHRDPEAG